MAWMVLPEASVSPLRDSFQADVLRHAEVLVPQQGTTLYTYVKGSQSTRTFRVTACTCPLLCLMQAMLLVM
jgi:hypothetical protein